MGLAATSLGTYTNTPVLKGATAPSTGMLPVTVFINGAPALRKDDPLAGGDKITMGSTSVNIQGQAAARILQDPTQQGGSILTGATNVFIGG